MLKTDTDGIFRPCVLIPCYNHGRTLAAVLEGLQGYGMQSIVVDDGSQEDTKAYIRQAAEQFPELHVVTLPQNGGKGAAVFAGAKKAAELGFTHFVQVDADGQHDLLQIAPLLKLAEDHPQDLISGQPVYDESVPKGRLIGRYITHFWVWVETLSTQLKDSMCGFRVYPLTSFLNVMNSHSVGLRMDFDIEIMVRLYWEGINVRFLPVKVIYPEDGISNFDVVADNIRISKMHAKLFFESFKHWPKLLSRKPIEKPHWAQIEERKGEYGFRFLVWIYHKGGRALFHFFLRPVILFFWLTGKTQREASQDFLRRVQTYRKANQLPEEKLSSLRHFMTFGDCVLDKIDAWSAAWKIGEQFVLADAETERLLTTKDQTRGKVLIVSHLGMAEACRAVAEKEHRAVINALVFEKHAQRVKRMLERANPDSAINLLPVNDIGMETAMMLEEKIARGEWVAIAGDRIPVTDDKNRTMPAMFLGEEAQFPIGAYFLASLLKCQTLTLFAVRVNNRYEIHAKLFADPVVLKRGQRQECLQAYVQQYARCLEDVAVRHPMNWFNFFDFWDHRESEEK